MKKYVFFIMSALFFATSFSSCNNDESLLQNETTESIQDKSSERAMQFTLLNARIDSLNNATFGITHQGVQTRFSLRRFFDKLIAIAEADAVGAGFGALIGATFHKPLLGAGIGAICASGWAAFHADSAHPTLPGGGVTFGANRQTRTISTEGPLDNVVFTANGSEPDFLDSLGYYHNAIIIAMYESCPEWFTADSLTSTDMSLRLNSFVSGQLAKYGQTINNDTEFVNAMNDLVEYFRLKTLDVLAFKDFTDMVISNNPDAADELELIRNYTATINIEDDDEDIDMQQYTVNLLELIAESELPDYTKIHLKAGIEVGYASSKLWNIDDNEENDN